MEYKIVNFKYTWLTWIVIFIGGVCGTPYYETECDKLPGAYSRDVKTFRCCKGRQLVQPQDSSSYFRMVQCESDIIEKNPDDELATSMWKEEACKIKTLMGSPEVISYKGLVDFLTQNYTTEDNVQSLIKDSNTVCPDGDKESEEHIKVQAYLKCFYKNEQQVCEVESANTTIYKNKLIQQYNLISLFNNSDSSGGCEPEPGIWFSKLTCCNGKRTPNIWMNYMATFPKWDRNRTSYSECYKEAGKLMQSYKLPENPTREDIEKRDDQRYSLRCNFGCNFNPGMITNGVGSQPINWNVDNALDKLYSTFTVKMKTIFKAYVMDKIKTAKVALTHMQSLNGTGISMEEIEKAYLSSEQEQKVKYFCSYYRGLELLANKAIQNYCERDLN